MSKENPVLKCDVCGLIVEVLHDCEKGCVPECCGKPMRRFAERSADGAVEKHVPVAEADPAGDGMIVRVGSVPHPMLPEHYIEWIEVRFDDLVLRQTLKPGDAPEASFRIAPQSGMVLRAYCNIHGLWTAKIE